MKNETENDSWRNSGATRTEQDRSRQMRWERFVISDGRLWQLKFRVLRMKKLSESFEWDEEQTKDGDEEWNCHR